MPDVFHTQDHHKHSRKWTLTGSWGSECVVCLVLLLDSAQSPIPKKKTLLKELNTLLRSSSELVNLLQDCELISRMQSSLLNALCVTEEEIAIESLTNLITKIKCTAHLHDKKLLDSTIRRFYKSNASPKLAKLLSDLMLQLAALKSYLRDGLVCGSFVGNLCDTLRPSSEAYQDVILNLLYEINNITPLHSLITEVRLTALLQTTIPFLEVVLLQPSVTTLLTALLPAVDRHRNRVFKTMGKSLVLGMRHALLCTKVPTVQEKALTILIEIGRSTPELISQCEMIDHILECLSSVDESVCINALTLAQIALSSSLTVKSCEAYVVDVIVGLINREKGQGRGRLVEECFNVLLMLPTLPLPQSLSTSLIDLLQWCDGPLIARILVTCSRTPDLFEEPRKAMVMLLALERWTQNNLSQRTLKISASKWLAKVQECCSEGEQVLALLLAVEKQLYNYIITMCKDEHGHLDVLQDLVTLCEGHCLQIVFSLDTKETCPHVYQHFFEIVMLCGTRCVQLEKFIRSNTSSPSFGDKFIVRTLKLSSVLFDIRSVLCSAYKDPTVLSTLHTFIWHILYLGTRSCLPQQDLQEVIKQGLEVLPFVTLEEAFTDCMTRSERLTFHTSLSTQPHICAQVTCLLAMFVANQRAGIELTITEAPVLQFIGLCCNNHSLPSFLLPLVLQLLALLPRTGHSLHPLVVAINTVTETQKGVDCSLLDSTTLKFCLSLPDVHPLFKARCAKSLLNTHTEHIVTLNTGVTESHTGLTETQGTGLPETQGTEITQHTELSQEIVGALIQAFLDNETPDRLFLLEKLVGQCTEEKMLEKVVLFVNRLFLHPTLKTETSRDLMKVLCSICYSGLVNSSLVRFISSLQENVICRGDNTKHAIQLIYLIYTNNNETVVSLLKQRYDFLSSLVSNIDTHSSYPLLFYSLLILLKVSRSPETPTVCLDLIKVLNVLDKCSHPLCLTVLWLLLRQWILDIQGPYPPLVAIVKDLVPVSFSTVFGLIEIALQNVCDLHSALSLSIGAFIVSAMSHLQNNCTEVQLYNRSLWYMFSITASLSWFSGLPCGVLLLLHNLTDLEIEQLTQDSVRLSDVPHVTLSDLFDKVFRCVCNGEGVTEKIVGAKLLIRLTHLQPSLLTPTHRTSLSLISFKDTDDWNKDNSEMSYHVPSLYLHSRTECKSVRKELSVLCESDQQVEMEH